MSGSNHWLVGAALRAGLNDGIPIDIAAEASIPDAWTTVSTACNMAESTLAGLVAEAFHLQLANLDSAEQHARRLLPADLVQKYRVFPIREDDKNLVVATSDPTNIDTEQSVSFASGRTAIFEVAPPSDLDEAITQHYAPDQAVERLLEGVNADVPDSVRVVEDIDAETVSRTELEMGPVVKLANLILRDATRQGASDIHIQPGANGGRVRFRVDGILHHYMQLPMPALNRVVSRIKILGKLDIADRLRPQDGRVRIAFGERLYDLRISTVPTRDSEKAVIRILDPESSGTLESTGLPPIELQGLQGLLAHREGIVLVTGPTGSGKTTTMYAALRTLSTEDVNIMTVEDPIEYELAGLTQIQVESRQGVTFASALRAILRQDPDVIFIGEIRDPETAEIAVQASLTGHLVLATLHTNDAVGTVRRLADLGLDRSAVAETLRGAVAQRLARRVCKHCAEPVGTVMTEEEERLGKRYRVTPTRRAIGCDHCNRTGYRGRFPVVELLSMSRELEDLVTGGATSSALFDMAVANGMRPLREVALESVREGVTTLQEVERVLGESADTGLPGSSATPSDAKSAILREIAIAVTHPEQASQSTPARMPTPSRDQDTPTTSAASTRLSESQETARTQSHILLVDDDGVNRAIARALLERDGYRVSEASDGEIALNLLRLSADYDLMVLDLNMPKVGGREVLTAVRSAVATVGLPVIILTGTTDPTTESELMNEGADDYIRKPIDPPRFTARVKATLRRAAM